MGQVRHGCATTTHAVRAAIQRSQASLATLSGELGINPKTVAKWRKRTTVEDLKTGPKALIHHPVRSRGGNCCGVPAAHAAAAGRLPLRVAAVDSAPDAVSVGSLPPAARHLPPTGRRGRQAQASALQALSDRLLPHGYRRGADRRRQALPVRRHRSHQQIRGHSAGRQS